MQKIFEVRASQKALSEKLNGLIQQGIKVISVTRGSFWSRIGFSYKWTVVLDIPETVDMQKAENSIEDMKNDLVTSSVGATIVLFFGIIGAFLLFGIITYFVIR